MGLEPKLKTVYIVSDLPDDYAKMFWENGWTIITNIKEASLICFTGGEDVTPSYYGEVIAPETVCNPGRDANEANIYLSNPDTPMVGICRGGQFLNVMCGGSIHQHVEGHALGYDGSHIAINMDGGEEISVSSAHHQMMDPTEEAEILLTSWDSKEVEACYYEEDNVLCFQPHPEYVKFGNECQSVFFEFIEEYLFKGEDVCVDS